MPFKKKDYFKKNDGGMRILEQFFIYGVDVKKKDMIKKNILFWDFLFFYWNIKNALNHVFKWKNYEKKTNYYFFLCIFISSMEKKDISFFYLKKSSNYILLFFENNPYFSLLELILNINLFFIFKSYKQLPHHFILSSKKEKTGYLFFRIQMSNNIKIQYCLFFFKGMI